MALLRYPDEWPVRDTSGCPGPIQQLILVASLLMVERDRRVAMRLVKSRTRKDG